MPRPTEYHYAETLECGHSLEVTAFVPVEATQRVGLPTPCYLCAPDSPPSGQPFRLVTGWRLMEPWEWQG